VFGFTQDFAPQDSKSNGVGVHSSPERQTCRSQHAAVDRGQEARVPECVLAVEGVIFLQQVREKSFS